MRSRAESGFVLVYVVLLIFVLALAGAVVLADYQIKNFTRQAASGVSAESVYKAITGNTNTEQYGYLRDVAPGLRQDGVQRFGPTVTFRRQVGTILA